jgi:DNA primase
MSGRAVDEIKGEKYWNYWNFPKSHYLFGENMVVAREVAEKQREGDKYEPLLGIAVVEGYLDAIKWWEYEIPTVALMGSSISKEQINLLKDYERLYIALDADPAGDDGTQEILCQLRNRMPLFRVKFPDGKTDPKQLTREEVWDALDSMKRIS